ncbi:MAG: hypothetical protein E4H03_08780 [Myxococcales bacterium]|nr:MAG: hypothetical protein E4H03_08780 [Myxococcales bacterium]
MCGDDVVDSGEECDDGPANSDADPATCRNDCAREFDCGDADDNGSRTVTDSAIVLQAAVGLRTDCDPGRCDTSGDGAMTVTDSQILLLNVVGLPVEVRCTRAVVVRLGDAVTLGALDFEIDYSATDSAFLGEGASVDCTSPLAGSTVVFDNDSAAGKLSVSVDDPAGFSGPTDIATCNLRERTTIATPADLVVEVIDASDPAAQPVTPTPSVSVNF